MTNMVARIHKQLSLILYGEVTIFWNMYYEY